MRERRSLQNFCYQTTRETKIKTLGDNDHKIKMELNETGWWVGRTGSAFVIDCTYFSTTVS
jgi:hypothetical protein